MVKKLLFIIAIAVFFISGCLPSPIVVPPAVPSEEAPGNGTTPPSAPSADQWSGWAQVPGGGTTDAALAATVFNSKIYLFGKGIDDKCIYVNTFGAAGD